MANNPHTKGYNTTINSFLIACIIGSYSKLLDSKKKH